MRSSQFFLPTLREKVEEAARRCPKQAIRLEG